MSFNSIYKGKKVIVTGNTGFKGAWLSIWLLDLGAEVYGISNNVPTEPSIFEEAKLDTRIKHQFIDIRDKEKLVDAVVAIQPDFLAGVRHWQQLVVVLQQHHRPALRIERLGLEVGVAHDSARSSGIDVRMIEQPLLEFLQKHAVR